IRIVSDILESNGSSSMASVCGGTLALMDAGVPIKSTVAGISIGLVYEEGKYVLLTDIQGEEDHAGDMDFKVAGTRKGVTAIQMDLKTPGVALSLLKEALEQAKSGRFAIMDIMEQTIGQSKKELSTYAPRMVQVKVPVNKIREVIGPGGKIINKIQDETGATISIEDDGTTSISAPNGESLKAAKEWVEGIIAEVEIGKIYTGKVTRVENFGAFVEVLPGKEGLVHISQIAQHRVQNVTDEVNLGDTIKVKAMEIDSKGRLNLSRKAAMGE
ncbi:MAG: S1 RNA-binding domain-containing protein, partial [Elusimicrobiota bacterium]